MKFRQKQSTFLKVVVSTCVLLESAFDETDREIPNQGFPIKFHRKQCQHSCLPHFNTTPQNPPEEIHTALKINASFNRHSLPQKRLENESLYLLGPDSSFFWLVQETGESAE